MILIAASSLQNKSARAADSWEECHNMANNNDNKLWVQTFNNSD